MNTLKKVKLYFLSLAITRKLANVKCLKNIEWCRLRLCKINVAFQSLFAALFWIEVLTFPSLAPRLSLEAAGWAGEEVSVWQVLGTQLSRPAQAALRARKSAVTVAAALLSWAENNCSSFLGRPQHTVTHRTRSRTTVGQLGNNNGKNLHKVSMNNM